MINPPVTLFPCCAFIVLAVLCFAAWGGIISLPGWMQTLGLYMGCASFLFACLCGLDWLIDRVTRYANIGDLLNPDARIAEAVCKANHEQLECLYNLYGFTPEPPAGYDYIRLDDGTAVDREAILQISQNARNNDLRPEREYTANQPAVRYAHDALVKTGVFEKARGSHGPKIKNLSQWEKIVEDAMRTYGR